MEDRLANGNYQRLEPKSSISILADSSYQFFTECFSPFTPSLLQNKTRSCKANHGHVFKYLERCEYKTTCRPPIQLFKAKQDYKVLKKIEETSVQTQRKFLKTNKIVNKIFQHNPTDSESLKIYRDLYIYKSIGSIARKNLERAIAIYNANREEIEFTRKFSSKRNSNSFKREQSNHKKTIKNEMYERKNKPKSNAKEKITKDLKYSLQEVNSSQSRMLQLLNGGTTVCKSMGKTIIEKFLDDVNEEKKFSKLEKSSNVPENQIKKAEIKNGGVKRILPKLQVRSIERKIKEKKQLPLAVLNISLPLLSENKEGKLHDLRPKIQEHKMKNVIYEDECKTYFNLVEELSPVSNRKIIVNNIRRIVYSPSKSIKSEKRGYLLKLPITEMKGNISSYKNLNLLNFQEPEISSTFFSPLNNNLPRLPKHVTKENSHSTLNYKKSTISNSWNTKKTTGILDPSFFEKEKNIGTSEFKYSFIMNDKQECCYKSKNEEYSKIRKILLNNPKSGNVLLNKDDGFKMTAKKQNTLNILAESIYEGTNNFL